MVSEQGAAECEHVDQCGYQVTLWDTQGDGWNGAGLFISMMTQQDGGDDYDGTSNPTTYPPVQPAPRERSPRKRRRLFGRERERKRVQVVRGPARYSLPLRSHKRRRSFGRERERSERKRVRVFFTHPLLSLTFRVRGRFLLGR
jgi:hypothetical protein